MHQCPTTNDRELIWPSGRVRRSHEQFTLPTLGKWWNCQRSVDFTIGTSAVPPDFLLAWWVEGFGPVRLLSMGDTLCGFIHGSR